MLYENSKSNSTDRYSNFDEMIAEIQRKKEKKVCVVAAAADLHTLEAVMRAYKDNIVVPVLVGDYHQIVSYLEKLGFGCSDITIIDSKSDENSADIAANLAGSGKADFIVKGLLETSTLMKAVLNKNNNLRTQRILSSVGFLEIPTYHKLLAITDSAINIHPDLSQKKLIIENAVELMKKMGINNPKVAVLAAVEVINPKMPETVEADELKKMNTRNEIKDCIIEGPISYDIAISKEAAEIKSFKSPVAGDADMLVYPDLTSGNLTSKGLIYSGNSKVAAIVTGAKVPIVLTSRSSSSEEKYLSIVLASAASGTE